MKQAKKQTQKRVIIEADHVSVQFSMANDRVNTLKEFVIQTVTKKIRYTQFWALRDVTFEIRKGDVLGIIGRNGAGKSTLLKVISGILKPTAGSVASHGNIVPMLELGSGFDFDLSGRENIYLNGAILGYSEEFLLKKYKEILEFSELEEFIEVPLRNYSSGMVMRLAFAIATAVSPEILIVDEILSVGDARFQEKSRKRMLEMMSGGTTVLFVSHELEQIRKMCNKVVWLEHGTVKAFGPAKEICDQYGDEG
ncbi:MAG: ABC transporter ATP-binding protein [Eubacterium sp.]|nr:ABC transporter ATP-binding protein [Eubacterium sp.]